MVFHCFRRTKIQNLSAIHNAPFTKPWNIFIVSDVQRYKICQQFTTCSFVNLRSIYCFRRTKIQNLSAIHNLTTTATKIALIVSDVQRYKICQQFTTFKDLSLKVSVLFQTYKDTKFVSNSQHLLHFQANSEYCFRRTKIQNLSAIHNSKIRLATEEEIVSDVQRYKICQQFTT